MGLSIHIFIFGYPFGSGIQSLLTQYPSEYVATPVQILVWVCWVGFGYGFGYWVKWPALPISETFVALPISETFVETKLCREWKLALLY